MMLVGIIFGLLFRSLSSFVIRLIDPNEFLVLQDRMFANFTRCALSCCRWRWPSWARCR